MSRILLTQAELDDLLDAWYDTRSRDDGKHDIFGEHTVSASDPGACHIDGLVRPSGVALIYIRGRHLGTDVSQVLARLCTLIRPTAGHVVIDLSECTYLSSFAVGAVLELAFDHAASGWRVYAAAPADTVRRVFALMEAERALIITDTAEEAVAAAEQDDGTESVPRDQE